jgi:hypothetical protein
MPPRARWQLVLIGALFGMTLLPRPLYAGAWTQGQGNGLAVISTSYYETHEFFDADGNTQPQERFTKQELNLYGEYGAWDSTTLGVNLFLNHVEQAGLSNAGLSNSELFVRQRIYRDDSRVISLQPLLKLPSLDAEDRAPRGGSKSTDGALYLLYGENIHVFSPSDYADMALGIRARSDGLAPQWHLEMKAGMQINDRLTVIPAFTIIQSINPDIAAAFAETGDLDFSLRKAELSAAYQLDGGRYVQCSVFSHVAGKQTGSGEGITLSYGVKF